MLHIVSKILGLNPYLIANKQNIHVYRVELFSGIYTLFFMLSVNIGIAFALSEWIGNVSDQVSSAMTTFHTVLLICSSLSAFTTCVIKHDDVVSCVKILKSLEPLDYFSAFRNALKASCTLLIVIILMFLQNTLTYLFSRKIMIQRATLWYVTQIVVELQVVYTTLQFSVTVYILREYFRHTNSEFVKLENQLKHVRTYHDEINVLRGRRETTSDQQIPYLRMIGIHEQILQVTNCINGIYGVFTIVTLILYLSFTTYSMHIILSKYISPSGVLANLYISSFIRIVVYGVKTLYVLQRCNSTIMEVSR
ncbi:hypothetical protein L9F63_011324, partial [Diploptera punctata]